MVQIFLCIREYINSMFRNNQQMHQFLSVYYFTLLLLHVSATVCHPQGTRLYLLSYNLGFRLIKFCVVLACNSEGTDELPEDDTQLRKHVTQKVQTSFLRMTHSCRNM
jgi:hypothetical protein